MDLDEILSSEEKESLAKEENLGTLSFIVGVLRDKMNLIATKSGNKVVYSPTNSSFVFPSTETIKEMFAELIIRDVISERILNYFPGRSNWQKYSMN